jgi:CubicO group peptidase (beta-lactamase class C family)
MIFSGVRALLEDAHRAGAFPAAVIEVGRMDGPLWSHPVGHLTFDATSPATDRATIFDLASLTKVIATTSIAMRQIAAGPLTLETPLGSLLPTWQGDDRAAVVIRQLLDHSSGLPAHARLWLQAHGRAAYEAMLAALPLDYPPGTRSLYSDPGFMLLGFALESAAGAPLDHQFAALAEGNCPGLKYGPIANSSRVAPTENDPWRGHVLVGEVHDENAAALDGVAGHAGLFGTAGDVGAFARLVLRTFREPTTLGSPAQMLRFATPTGVPGSSRALGWDTMRPTSSCGARMSPTAIGHTGFTGTSLWIDRERNLYVVLLSNRVHPSRANDAFVALRPRVHDAVLDALGLP